MREKPEDDFSEREPFSVDMGIEEALKRFAKITKEEAAGQKETDGVLQEGQTQLVLFRGKEIRQIFHNDEWHFSVIDVVEALTGSDRPSKYWNVLKKQLVEKEDFSELSDKIGKLPMLAQDGKMRPTDSANVETIFRIVQSIPAKKAEPFKKWLAKVGYERIQEIQDPEIAIKRAMLTYKAKGYPDEWVNARIQTIVSRKELTHEWGKRGVKEGIEYAILTNTISKGTFEVDVDGHRRVKGLKKHHNLRDHMSPLELALTMLGETTTAEFARAEDAKGFHQNQQAAKTGGDVAGSARRNIEKRLGRKVVTKDNFLPGSNQTKIT